MGIVLFDWKTTEVAKKGINSSFSKNCLFDGYLTEPTSYPHFSKTAYLTTGSLVALKTCPNVLFSGISLFDGYLTKAMHGGKI
jgi:hypothetical protein